MFKKDISGKILGDRDLQKIIGTLLRFGVVTASIIALIGGIIYLSVHGMEMRPVYNTFHGEPSAYTSFAGIMDKVFSLDARGIMQLGAVVLIMTPILRVVCSLFSFAIEGDRMYVVITLVVLSVILFSMFSGVKL
jgi:Predicted membrane protein